MKKIVVKLSFLTVLSGLYLAGLSATTRTITPGFQACCKGGGATCCGASCTITTEGCIVSK